MGLLSISIGLILGIIAILVIAIILLVVVDSYTSFNVNFWTYVGLGVAILLLIVVLIVAFLLLRSSNKRVKTK